MTDEISKAGEGAPDGGDEAPKKCESPAASPPKTDSAGAVSGVNEATASGKLIHNNGAPSRTT
jgi:hypothetical protein